MVVYGVKGWFFVGFEGRGGCSESDWGVWGEAIVWGDVVVCRTGGRGACLGEVVCGFGMRSLVGFGVSRSFAGWGRLSGPMNGSLAAVTAPAPTRLRSRPNPTGAAPPPLGAAAAAFARGRPAALRRPRRAGPPCGSSATAPSSGRWISPTRRSWWGESTATAGASGREAPTIAGCRAR